MDYLIVNRELRFGTKAFYTSQKTDFSYLKVLPNPRKLEILAYAWHSGSQSVVLVPAVGASPGSLLEMQIFRPSSTKPGILGLWAQVLTSPLYKGSPTSEI